MWVSMASCFLSLPITLSSLHRNHHAPTNALSIRSSPALFNGIALANQPSRHSLISRASLAAETAGKDTTPTPAEVEQGVSLLKSAARKRRVPAREVCGALRLLETAKLDPSGFLQTIGGTESPGRTWMLVFTSSKESVAEFVKGGPGGGKYFPVTAVQRFDAAAMRIENGLYLGPLGSLILEGPMSWQKRILAFLFESVKIKIGPLGPFKFSIKKREDEGRVPTTKDPFFIWYYADNEIIVAKGKSGGIAFWCSCSRVFQ